MADLSRQLSITAPQLVSRKQVKFASTVFFFISGFGYAAWASRIPTIKQELNLSEAQLGSVLFAMPVGLMATMPLTKYLLGRFPSRQIMLAGVLLFNLALCLTGWVSATWQLVALLFAFGSSRNLFNLSLNAQAVSVQQLYEKSIITTFHGIWSLAGFAGAALGYLMSRYNIGTAWHLPLVGLSMMVLAMSFFGRTLYQQPVKSKGEKIFALPDKHLLRFSFICFVSMACENTMYDWSGIYFHQAVHTSTQTATTGFVVYMVAMTLGRLAGDRLVNRFGIRPILFYSGVLISTGLAMAVALPYPVTAAVGFILTGFGVSCVVPLVFSLAGKTKSLNSASALASISTIGYLGFLLVPPTVGYVAQAAGIRFSFALMAALGTVIVWLMRKSGPEE
jgi:MFS family permease